MVMKKLLRSISGIYMKRSKEVCMKKLKRIFAIAGVAVLLGMYLLTFVSALLATPGTHALFLGSLAATIIVPVFLYAYSLIYKVIYKKEDRETGEVLGEDKETKSKKAFDEVLNRESNKS